MGKDARYLNSYPNKAIRARAAALGLTSPELADKVNKAAADERAEKPITPEAVRQWVCGYSQPKYERLPDLAAALDCSLRFLFGLDESPRPDQQAACEITGLSSEAVEWLAHCQSDDARASMSRFLDVVITSGELLNLALAFWHWERARVESADVEPLREQAQKLLVESGCTVSEAAKIMETRPEIFEKIELADQRMDAAQYRMEEAFRFFLNAVKEKRNHGHD